MEGRTIPEKFLVAFSLAGEQRELVRAVAEAVEAEVGRPLVFLDEWFEYYLAGNDADLHLREIYMNRSELVVICVSKEYRDKPWTAWEFEAVRARYAQVRNDEGRRLAVLPIRVGDGDLAGLPAETAIVPDIREKTISQAADLILSRLRLLLPNMSAVQTGARQEWLDSAPELHWLLADHGVARTAFQNMLAGTAQYRVLCIEGASGTGKTILARQMLRNLYDETSLSCGLFDFKGTSDIHAEVTRLARSLAVVSPPETDSLVARLNAILASLERRSAPTVLIFDGYDQAGHAKEWITRDLLWNISQIPWLRVVLLGQELPESRSTLWASVTHPKVTLLEPSPEDWLLYARQIDPDDPDVDLILVERIHGKVRGVPSILDEIFGSDAV